MRRILKHLVYKPLYWLYRKIAAGARFYGNFTDWEDAGRHASGYDSAVIVKRVSEAARKVKDGESAFERDSVLFEKIQYSWPLLAGILWIANQKENRLKIVDFGGSLGSTYYQNKFFISQLREYRWCIVEQNEFVKIGSREFEDGHLKFYGTLDECCNLEHPDVIVLSSVLQYLPDPWSFLDSILSREFEFIIVDRTPLFESGKERLTVQKVPQWIYPASYRAWILPLDRFLARFEHGYDLIADFESSDLANISAVFKGFLFKKKNVSVGNANAIKRSIAQDRHLDDHTVKG